MLSQAKDSIVVGAMVDLALHQRLTGEEVATRMNTMKYGYKLISK